MLKKVVGSILIFKVPLKKESITIDLNKVNGFFLKEGSQSIDDCYIRFHMEGTFIDVYYSSLEEGQKDRIKINNLFIDLNMK